MSPIGSKIDFKRDPIFESAAWFFFIILKFIYTSIFEIKIHDSLGVNIIFKIGNGQNKIGFKYFQNFPEAEFDNFA